MKKILFCIVATMFATMAFAQQQHRQPRQFNPEEMAQRQTLRLHEALQLDSVQLQAVFLINYADALTMQDSINARRERAEKMRAEGKKPERVKPSEEQMKAMAELQKQREQVRNEQMKQILNTEQYEKYLKYQEEQRDRMRQGYGRRPGRGGRPGGAPRGE
ncbi:MAG: DUF4890 domain-containing protein [Bacteroidaceae bacterium]|nr:DUF4890 domain-containing protein [Bacteroidaceae bacterium]